MLYCIVPSTQLIIKYKEVSKLSQEVDCWQKLLVAFKFSHYHKSIYIYESVCTRTRIYMYAYYVCASLKSKEKVDLQNLNSFFSNFLDFSHDSLLRIPSYIKSLSVMFMPPICQSNNFKVKYTIPLYSIV